MRIDKVYIESFKNLKQFSIDFDETQMNTVLLGENATGKSNFIEAIILIFKYIDLGKTPPAADYFDYMIEYKCHNKNIFIQLKNRKYTFKVNGLTKSKSDFLGNKSNLPKYVFTYYSGLSDRLNKLFWQHQKQFYNEVKKPDFSIEKVDNLRRLFYVQQVHSYFVLLAFYSINKFEKDAKDFLNNILHIDDVESFLFILKDPGWRGKGDPRFWGADGLVKEFLSVLMDYSLAPIIDKQNVDTDFRHTKRYERLYLYISKKEKLQKLVLEFLSKLKLPANNVNLFKALESTYISELLEEVRIKVRKKSDGEVTFRQLSEGEQQLLTVLGLLKFTKDDESLVLLDEPDTHLNPAWKWQYINLLNDVVKKPSGKEDDTTQVIINTHDPLVIGGLEASQVRVFNKDWNSNTISIQEPDESPRGMGINLILRSDMFGLATTLDEDTNEKVVRRNFLASKEKITEKEEKELAAINEDLDPLGFNFNNEDPDYITFFSL